MLVCHTVVVRVVMCCQDIIVMGGNPFFFLFDEASAFLPEKNAIWGHALIWHY